VGYRFFVQHTQQNYNRNLPFKEKRKNNKILKKRK